MARRLFFAALLVTLPAGAQPVAPAPVCDSILFKAPVATVEDTLRLLVRPGNGMPALPRQWADFLLDEVATRLRFPLPQPLLLDVYDEAQPPLPPTLPMEIEPSLFSEVRVTLRRDGRLVDAELVTRSLVNAADRALMSAIAAADSARALPAFTATVAAGPSPGTPPGASPDQPVVVFLNLTRASLPEVMQPLAAAPHRDLAKLLLPRLRGAEPARPMAGIAGPRFPESEKTAGRDGRAVVQFIVDTNGTIAEGTASVLSFTALPFAASALEFLPRARFIPASLGGCPIRQLVQQPFEFRLFPGAPPRPF